MTWNVNSLRDLHSEPSSQKTSQLKNLTNNSIVLLQETKSVDTQSPLLHTKLPTVRILSSNAIQVGTSLATSGDNAEELPTANEVGLSGGVAILLPSYIWHSLEHSPPEEIVPGYVISQQICTPACNFLVVSFYLRPAQEKQILQSWQEVWRQHPPHQIVIAGGDLNQVIKHQDEFESFLTEF